MEAKKPDKEDEEDDEEEIEDDISKKEKSKKRKTFEDVFIEKDVSGSLKSTLQDFIDMRKTIKKPMTSKALDLLIVKVRQMSILENEQIAILNQSIERGWQTVYPLKIEEAQITNKGGMNDFKELMKEAQDEQSGNDTSNNPSSW